MIIFILPLRLQIRIVSLEFREIKEFLYCSLLFALYSLPDCSLSQSFAILRLMNYILMSIIIILLAALAFLLKKIYGANLEASSKTSGENNSVLKSTWNRFDELLTSLINIHDVGMVNVGTIKKQEFYQTVLDSACDLMQSHRGSLMMYNEETKRLSIVSAKGISKEVMENTVLKAGDGVAGRAFQTGETIFVTDPQHNNQYADYEGAKDQKEPFVAIPLKNNDKSFGVLNVHISRSDETFTDYDLKFLNLLAGESAITLENIKLYESIENFYLEMVQTLARVIDAKDAYTGDHAGRARKKARHVAKKLHMPEQMIRYVEYAALLHDIGKIGIEGSILTKPGRLNADEYAEIKKHPSIGHQILSPINFLGPVAQMVLYHQEWYNGMGYPQGLKGEEIPLGARIVATIDAWDAMMSDRPYRKALTIEQAINELKKGSGTQFDPKVVEAFLQLEEKEWKNNNCLQ